MSGIGFTTSSSKTSVEPELREFQGRISDDSKDIEQEKIDITKPSKSMKDICSIIESEIVGQDIAKATVFRVLERVRANLTRVLEKNGDKKKKPISTLFFAGPTGVGKTQMAKSTQKALNLMFENDLELIKINCADFTDPQGHGLNQLKGASMGYIGCDQKATLHPDRVKGRGRVVLFDEIEKGGTPLWNLLLAILDDGVLDINYLKKVNNTDSISSIPYNKGEIVDTNGDRLNEDEEEDNIVKAYFKDSVVIMTSNLGTREMQKMLKGGIGFTNGSKNPSLVNEEMQKIIDKALSENSRPEFKSRVNHIIPFSFLSIYEYREILDRFISLMVTNLLQGDGVNQGKHALLDITENARDFITYEVFTKHGDKGVRALPTYILDTIVAALAISIDEDAFIDMDKVLKVKVENNKLAYYIVDLENCDMDEIIKI